MSKINGLKMSLKKNKTIDAVSRIIAYPMFAMQYRKSDKQASMRKNGKEEKDFLWLKDLINKYEGKRCFVVATGPSLTIADLDLIKGEYSFGMNSSIFALKDTSWRPNFYVVQDEYVYRKIEQNILSVSEEEVPEVWVSENIEKQFVVPNRFKIFPLHYMDHKMYHRKGYGKYKFSDDCYSCIFDAYSVTFSILQLAIYMGFKEIYLIGCDCNYNLDKTHFIEYGHKDPKASIMGDKMIMGHYEFKKFADSLNVKVINCTRGGMLEIYPRMNLQDVLSS